MKPSTRATLDLLRERPQGVTAIDALAAIGSFRLAARVAELRSMGYVVRGETVRVGAGKHVTRYTLEEQMGLAL